MAISALCAKAILRKGKARYAGPKSSAKRGTIIGEAWNRYRSCAQYAVKDLDELREIARTMETIKDNRFASLEGIDRATIILEHRLEHAETQQERTDLTERIERFGQARRFAVEYRLLPEKDPEYIRTHPYSQRSSTSWSDSSSSHRSSNHQEHSIERSSRDDIAR